MIQFNCLKYRAGLLSNRLRVWGLGVLAALAVLVIAAAPVAAQDGGAVFPPTLRVGLVPPPNFVVNPALPGFRHVEARAEIRVAELPGYAYETLVKQIDAELTKETPTAERHPISLGEGITGVLVRTAQTSPQGPILQWTLIARSEEVTALVTALIPEAIQEVAPEAAVMASLASLTFRASVPVAEQLDALPFALRDLAGYRIVRVQPGAAVMLTEGDQDAIRESEQPMLLISIAPAPSMPRPEEREGLARRLIGETPGLKELRVQRSEPLRIGGQQGHELLLEGKDAEGDHTVSMVQWLRFGAGAIMRIVGIVRKEDWEEHYPRFRTVRDGIGPR